MARDSYGGLTEQSKAAKHRLADARALFKEKRWRATMYVAGYVIECLLKAKLMQTFRCRHLRELEEELHDRGLVAADATVFTHRLEVLLRLARGLERLRRNPSLWKEFSLVNRWIPAWRYTADLSNRDDAEDFLSAIEKSGNGSRITSDLVNVMADSKLKAKIYDVLKQGLFDDPDDLVDVSDGPDDGIHVVVVSRKFDGKRMKEKNDLIWAEVTKGLKKSEWTLITLLIGASPEEIKAT